MVRRTTTQRGLGWKHEQQRTALGRHRDGARCWWCGEPMYRDAARNRDGESLAADPRMPELTAVHRPTACYMACATSSAATDHVTTCGRR